MARPARPSDVYRLPEQQRRTSAPEEPQPQPRRRIPLWAAVAGLLAVVLAASGLVRGASTTMTGEAPVVDIVSEDQAIAALALYDAQVSAIDDLKQRRDIFAGPGPRDAAMAADAGARKTQDRLSAARDIAGADPLATAYYNAAGHPAVIDQLRALGVGADLVNLLASTHDTIYDGSGSIPLNEAYEQITGNFTDTSQPPALRRWATALLEQMEERDRAAEAAAARAETAELWASTVAGLEPAAVDALRAYVQGLPAVTIEGLRGHPLAGPGLKHLDRDERVVSTAG